LLAMAQAPLAFAPQSKLKHSLRRHLRIDFVGK